ncbi:MAG: hypothetical protein ACP5O8_04265 [Candidatus Aenigmatarchaeota archaeon]
MTCVRKRLEDAKKMLGLPGYLENVKATLEIVKPLVSSKFYCCWTTRDNKVSCEIYQELSFNEFLERHEECCKKVNVLVKEIENYLESEKI